MLDSAALLSSARDAYTAGMQGRLQNQTKGNSGMNEQQVRQAAEQFESFFIGQMLEHMHTDVDGQGLFGGGHAEDVWRSMLNQEYGKEIAKSSSLGIADSVMRSLIQAQSNATTGQQAPPMESIEPMENIITGDALAGDTEKRDDLK